MEGGEGEEVGGVEGMSAEGEDVQGIGEPDTPLEGEDEEEGAGIDETGIEEEGAGIDEAEIEEEGAGIDEDLDKSLSSSVKVSVEI